MEVMSAVGEDSLLGPTLQEWTGQQWGGREGNTDRSEAPVLTYS